MIEKKVSVSEKKIGSNTNMGGTEIGPWFPIPKPNFGLTLVYILFSESVLD